jgi:hypothetical protein
VAWGRNKNEEERGRRRKSRRTRTQNQNTSTITETREKSNDNMVKMGVRDPSVKGESGRNVGSTPMMLYPRPGHVWLAGKVL